MELDRRTLLFSLLATPVVWSAELAQAQDAAALPDPSLYIPKAHVVEERKFLHDFMDEFSFVDLVTATPTLRITHIPSVLDRTKGRFGAVLGHISAQNPQRATFDGAHTAVIVFRGPHGYISPAGMRPRGTSSPHGTSASSMCRAARRLLPTRLAHVVLATLIKKNEGTVGSTSYDFAALPAEYVSRMMQGISPFEMEIETIEGKFKLGQERSEGDRQGVLGHMREHRYKERSLFALTEAFYRTMPK